MSMISLSIYRFDPEKDKKPYMQSYEVDITKVPGTMLLNILEHIKSEQDQSLTFRRSCREGVCGSDGMNINGVNGLACIINIADLPKKVTIRPLPGMPVIRDLVVDMDNFFKQLERAEPYLINNSNPTEELLQSPADRAKLDGYYECILCGCCSAACPSYWWNPEKFLGPAALLASARFLLDSRDQAKSQRLAKLQDAYKVFRCRGIMNCIRVCPKGLNPTKAIGKIKHMLLEEAS